MEPPVSITVVLVAMTFLISWQAFNRPEMLEKMLFRPYLARHGGEWHRMLSAGFVHANWMHLGVNLYVLYQFGPVIESFFGYLFGPLLASMMYMLFYLSAIIISSLPAYFRYQNAPGYGELGASGATSALVCAYVMLDPWQWFIFPPLPAILFAVAYIWYSNYMSRHDPGDHIAHGAHFAGGAYGFGFIIVAGLLYKPDFLWYFLAKLLEGPVWPF